MDDIVSDLNPSQYDAVTFGEGPLLVVAGAGSGKTRVLTRRIAYLIAHGGVSPFEILSITFTNKAASEMIERVTHLVGGVAARMWVSTFHSACARMLRIDGDPVGVKSGFSIYDVSDATRLIDYARRDLGADPKRFAAKSLYKTISGMKNELLSPAQALERAEMDTHRTVANIYAEYEHRLRAANAVDFDDLLVKSVELLRDHDDKREKYQSRFSHVLVDEFQDTNLAQWELVNLLANKHQNITVVGDADQSIYKFRGADHLNLQRFEEQYPDARVVVLNTNYRSTENILSAANAVISHNSARHKKELISHKGQGEPITVFYANTDRSESEFVANTISSLSSKYKLNDVAVFYRTNAQSRLIEEHLIRGGVSYRIIGGTKFFDRKEVKDAIAYLRIFANPADEASWRRIINEPKRGIGDTSVAKIAAHARSYDISFRKACDQIEKVGLSKRASSATRSLCTVFDVAGNGELIQVGDVLDYLLQSSGYYRSLEEDGSFEAQGRLENLVELISQAREFDSAIDKKWKDTTSRVVDSDGASDRIEAYQHDDEKLLDPTSPIERVNAFLEAVSLLAESDQANQSEESVTLMTLHTAKGLEYPIVFIVGLEEGLFPHERSAGDPAELEEERRLCYVGITRAMDKLYLSCATSRYVYSTANYFTPSRFLKEIPAELVEAVSDIDRGVIPSGTRDLQRNSRGGSRYGDVYDDVTFDDLNPEDRDAPGRVFGRNQTSINKKRRAAQDFAAAEMIRSRIWGDSDESSEEEDLPMVSDSFNVDRFSQGIAVRHAKYGEGTVVSSEKQRNGDVEIKVDFPDDKVRTFMASLSPPLEIL
jgi:DNA helicase-2/ATP-dependent DNA helicase PcrA